MLVLTTGNASAQSANVSGNVVDENKEGVIGATIKIAGASTVGTITDLDGNFTIKANPGDTLVISYIGYDDRKVVYDGHGNLKISLKPSEKILDEVVVIGYGTTKAKNFTGSVDVVKMEDSPIADMGLTSANDMLRNRMSGVIFGSESGTVGSSSSIQIRGQKSIKSTSEEPLIILNGVIFSGKLDDIDPSSIESVSALKDATSLAAYGSKAANGVIMVTTKKGKEGKPLINFSTSQEFSSPTYSPKYLDGEGYIRYRNAKVGNADLTNTSWMSTIEKQNYADGKTTDWVDLCLRTGYTQTYNLNVSGASKNTNYYIGGNHADMKGITKGNHFKRNNLTMNLTTNVADWLKVGTNVNYTDAKNYGVPAALDVAFQSPYGSAYLPDGRWRKFVEGGDFTAFNPLWDTYNGIDFENKRSNFVIGGFASIDIPWIEGLNYRINASYTKQDIQERRFAHESNFPTMLTDDIEGLGYTPEYYDLSSANGYSTSSKQTSWVIDNILSYAHSFGQHDISASLVYTRDYDRLVGEHYEGSDFSSAGNTILGWYGLGNASNKTFKSPTYTLHTDVGYLGRIIYAYKSTYHANFSLRRDGSSVFGSKKKWGNFPAVGLAWTISNEKWMKRFTWLDNLKLKLSWGKNGAQTLEPYGSLTKISVANDGAIPYYYGGTVHWGQKISSLGNPELGWQTTQSWNGGFEADLFKRRLHFEINLYDSRTTNQIFDRQIPIMTAGIATQKATMGRVDNKGVEINANSVNVKNKNLTWTSDLTFSLNRNKLVDLYGDGKDDITSNLFIGKSLGAIYGYRTDGIFQSGENAGTPIFLTADGQQTANPSPNDRVILGYKPESFRMSLGNTIKWKNFQFYVLFSGIFSGGGYGKADNTKAYMTYFTQNRCNALDIPFWTVDNPSNKYPSPSYSNPGYHYHVFENITQIRLQDISLSYNITPLVAKWGFHNAKVAISGRNLFYIAPGWAMGDPAATSVDRINSGIPTYTLGLPRTLTLSISLTY